MHIIFPQELRLVSGTSSILSRCPMPLVVAWVALATRGL